MKKIKKIFGFSNRVLKPVFADHRGKIFDFVEGSVGHVGMVTFREGATRGNHYHKKSIQHSYVLDGKIKLVVSDVNKKWKKELILAPGALTKIPPRVIHTYTALTPARMIDITTLKRGQSGYEDDTYRVSKK